VLGIAKAPHTTSTGPGHQPGSGRAPRIDPRTDPRIDHTGVSL